MSTETSPTSPAKPTRKRASKKASGTTRSSKTTSNGKDTLDKNSLDTSTESLAKKPRTAKPKRKPPSSSRVQAPESRKTATTSSTEIPTSTQSTQKEHLDEERVSEPNTERKESTATPPPAWTEKANAMAEKMGEALGHAVDTIQVEAKRVAVDGSKLLQQAHTEVVSLSKKAAEQVKTHPLRSSAFAVSTGALLGALAVGYRKARGTRK